MKTAVEVPDGLNIIDFIEGMAACQNGQLSDPSKSESWLRGWGAEYQLEEINSKQAERNETIS